MAEIIFWPAVMSPSPFPPLPWAWLAVTPAAMLPVSSSTQYLFGFCPVLIALRTDAMSSAAPRIGPSGQFGLPRGSRSSLALRSRRW